MLPPFEVDEYPWSAIFSPSRDGKFVALGGQVLRLWNVQTGEKVESFDIDVYSFALSPDGTCIAAGCGGSYVTVVGDGRGCYNIRVINLGLAKISYSDGFFIQPSGTRRIKKLF